MTKKSIIAIYGRQNEGKSEIIKRVCQLLIANHSDAIPSSQIVDYNTDVLLTIQIGTIKIGIESQGDPGTRMLNEGESIEQLAKTVCDIIICVSRSRGETVNRIDEVANKYGYETIWKSSYYSPHHNHRRINHLAAKEVFELVNHLMSGYI